MHIVAAQRAYDVAHLRCDETLQRQIERRTHARAIGRDLRREREQKVRRRHDVRRARPQRDFFARRTPLGVGVDVAGAPHAFQNVTLPCAQRGEPRVRVEPHGIVGQRGEQGRLREVEVGGVNAEIRQRRRLDAVQIPAHRRAIAPRCQYLVFRHPRFEPRCNENFDDLAARVIMQRYERARELHGQRRSPVR